MERGKKGVITVYLALTLLILTSLIFVMIESARTAGARFFVRNAGDMAASSVLADFYDPLFERYRVYGRDSKAADMSGKQGFVKQEFVKVLEKNLPADPGLFGFESVETEVTDCVALTDYKGAFFRQQAVEYMEYRGVSFAFEKLLETLGVFGDASKVSQILQEEEQVAEELEEIDKKILKLMQKTDGIKIGDEGIKLGWTGKVKTVDEFIKKMVPGEPSMEKVSVQVAEIFEALKNKYEDPLEFADDMFNAAADVLENENKKAANEAEIADLRGKIESVYADDPGKKAELNARILLLLAENALLDGKRMIAESRFNSAKKKLDKLEVSCEKAVNEAVSLVKEIEELGVNAKPEVYHYLETLANASEWLDADMLQGLLESAEVFEEYIGDKPAGTGRLPDIEEMKKTLLKDKNILEDVRFFLNDLTSPLSFDVVKYGELKEILREYSFEGLKFDYTGLKFKASAFNPFESIKSLVADGLAGLVLSDAQDIPSASYTGIDLPSKTVGITAEGQSPAAFFEDMGSLFADSPLNAIAELLKNGTSELAEDALYIAYLFDNFSYFGSEERESSRCRYEIEYIINGALSDKENLNGVLARIVAVRTVMCLIHIVTCRDKCAEAAAFATSVLGFTGMPLLVKLLQYSLILVWAYEEALVETAILMRGKRFPAVPTEGTFLLSFPEAFATGKTLINEKAEEYAGKTGLSYRDYLMILLVLQDEGKQTLRTMDVVQENLRLSAQGFLMSSMLCGFNLKAKFTVPAVFPNVLNNKKSFVLTFEGTDRY